MRRSYATINDRRVIKLKLENLLTLNDIAAFTICLSAIGCFAANGEIAQKNDSFVPSRSFSAILVEYNKDSAEAKSETRLLLSEHGMRTEKISSKNKNINLVIIQNYQTGQEWLMDPGRRIFSELPQVRHRKDLKVSDNNQAPLLGVLTKQPCAGMAGEKQSVNAIDSSKLSTWRCSDKLGRIYLQHYSSLLGTVVRQESEDGQISELKDIAFIDDSPEHFKPANTLQEVALDEFILGAFTASNHNK